MEGTGEGQVCERIRNGNSVSPQGQRIGLPTSDGRVAKRLQRTAYVTREVDEGPRTPITQQRAGWTKNRGEADTII